MTWTSEQGVLGVICLASKENFNNTTGGFWADVLGAPPGEGVLQEWQLTGRIRTRVRMALAVTVGQGVFTHRSSVCKAPRRGTPLCILFLLDNMRSSTYMYAV